MSGGFPLVCQLQPLSPEPISTGRVIQDACFWLTTPWKPGWPKYNSIPMLRSGQADLLPPVGRSYLLHSWQEDIISTVGDGAAVPPKSIASLCLAGHMTVGKHFISLDLSFFFCNLKQFR